jgi:hypothetical protein
MSTYNVTEWPISDIIAVCDTQNVVSAGALLLNGILAKTYIPNQISFINASMIRSVSITSTANLSGITFTISGLQNGAFITEILTGPNNTTIYGTKYYDIISSVVASGAASTVSVGSGTSGFFPIVSVNTNNVNGNVNYSVAALTSTSAGITYSLYQTLEQVNNNYIAFANQRSVFFPALGLTNETTSQMGNSTAITNYLLLEIVSSSTPLLDSLNFIFLQE